MSIELIPPVENAASRPDRREEPRQTVRPRTAAMLLQPDVPYRDLLNALPAAIYTTDAEGRITFFNEAAVDFAGRRPMIGDQWCVTWRLYHPDGAPLPHDECPMAIALKEKRPVRGAEAIAERPDGTRVAFIPYPTPLFDESGEMVAAVNMLVDITHRKESETRQALLTHEVNHRANNLLAVVQAMVRLTKGRSVEAFRGSLEGRIAALAQAHNLLAKSRWSAADLQSLVQEELEPYFGAAEPRVWVSGQALPLAPQAAQSMAMAVHELATNAAKYGALSNETGQIRIEWRMSETGELIFRWSETGGPPTRAPRRVGVGSKVITGAISQLTGDAHFNWRRDGLVCEIVLPPGSTTPD